MDIKHLSFDHTPYRESSETDEEYRDKAIKAFYLLFKKHLRDMDFSKRVSFNIHAAKREIDDPYLK